MSWYNGLEVDCRQKNRPNALEFIWTIRNFGLTGTFSRVYTISKPNEAQLQGQFIMGLLGERCRFHEDGRFVFELLKLNTSSESSLIVESDLIIVDGNNLIRCSEKLTKQEITPLQTLRSKIDRIISVNDMQELLNSDVIFIKCTIKYERKFNFQLTNHLSKLMEDGIFSDVVIKMADGSRFPAHKCILARSPVFAAMFNHDMKENRESTVVIEDVQANVLRALFRYMYSGTCDVDDVDVGKLLAAADKYALEDLKVKCEKELMKNININNAVYCLLLGERHNVQLLMERARAFILSNFYEVLKTNSMRNLAADRPSLFYQLVKDTYEW